MSRGLVNSATSDDQSLPGGYLLKQIADRTRNSASDSHDIQSYLRSRLMKTSPDVKFKALLCIKYVAQHGAESFRANFQRDNNAIRECGHFRGPADALRGDKPYQKVRDLSKETLTAIFAAPSTRAQTTSNRIHGMGSNNASSSSPPHHYQHQQHQSHEYSRGTYSNPSEPRVESGAYSSGRMQGFGNPAYNNSSRPSFVDKIKGRMTTNDTKQAPYRPYEGAGPYVGPSVSRQEQQAPAPMHANVAAPRRRGQVGGGWGSQAAVNAAAPMRTQQQQRRTDPPAPRSQPPPSSHTGNGSSTRQVRQAKASTGEFETRLVDAVTQPSGVRTVPSASELREFVDKARNVDGVLLASILQTKFSSSDWRTQLKALCVVEKLIEKGFRQVSEYFCNELAELVQFESSSIKQIAGKSTSILVLLGIKQVETSTTQVQVVSKPILPDLVDIGSVDDDNDTAGSAVGMFADMSVKSDVKPVQQAAAAVATDPLESLFANDTSAAPPASSSQPQQQLQKQQGSNVFGLFADVSSPSQPAPAAVVASAPASTHSSGVGGGGGDAFGLFASGSTDDNVDPLASLLGDATIDPVVQQRQQQQQQQQHHMTTSSPRVQPNSGYNQFSSMPLTMDPPSDRFGYGGQSPQTSQPTPPSIDFTVKSAPQGGPRATNLRPTNVFDDLTTGARKSPKKKTDGFNFVNTDDSFAFVQDEMKI